MVTPNTVDQVANFCVKHHLLAPADKIVVGVSGGADSLGLLHLLRALAPRFNLTLTAAHLNHRLRGESAQADAEFVQEICQRWGIPLVMEARPVAQLAAERRQSLEEAARQVRYAFLWQVAHATGSRKIAVGHNADDQTETVLMHFLRGSGLLGLRGMLPAVTISGLRLHPADLPPAVGQSVGPLLIRPWLRTPRAAIEAYCYSNGLHPRQDHTNLDTTYFRNRLRHELIPYLETFNPNIRAALQRTAQVAAAEADLLAQQLQDVWPQLVRSESARHVTFNLASWRNLPPALQRSALRRAIEHLRRGLRDISFEHIENALEIMAAGGVGAQASLPQGLLLTVEYHTFTVAAAATPGQPAPPETPQIQAAIPVNLPGETRLPDSRWRLVVGFGPAVAAPQPATPWEACLDAAAVSQPLILRPRQPGDTFCPLGMGGKHQKINEFMINAKIPANWRPQIPLLVAGEQVVWVCGYRPAETAKIQATTQQVLHLKFEAD